MVAGPYQAPAQPNAKPPTNATATTRIVDLEWPLGANSAMISSRLEVEKSNGSRVTGHVASIRSKVFAWGNCMLETLVVPRMIMPGTKPTVNSRCTQHQ
jgi:hypothetical protein